MLVFISFRIKFSSWFYTHNQGRIVINFFTNCVNRLVRSVNKVEKRKWKNIPLVSFIEKIETKHFYAIISTISWPFRFSATNRILQNNKTGSIKRTKRLIFLKNGIGKGISVFLCLAGNGFSSTEKEGRNLSTINLRSWSKIMLP